VALSIISYLSVHLFLIFKSYNLFFNNHFPVTAFEKELFSSSYINNFTDPWCQVMAKILSNGYTGVIFLPEDGKRAGF